MSSHSILVLIEILLFIWIFSVNIIWTETRTNIRCPKSDYYPLEILNNVTPKGSKINYRLINFLKKLLIFIRIKTQQF
jgi:hypothetical protein